MMVRKDICDEAIVKNLGEVVGKVLPHAMQEAGPRATLGQVLNVNKVWLAAMQRDRTIPPPSKESRLRFPVFPKVFPFSLLRLPVFKVFLATNPNDKMI